MTDKDYEKGIATIIKDYRKKEIKKPLDCDHVHRWIIQFDPSDRHAILSETFYVLSRYYFKDKDFDAFIREIISQCGELSKAIFMDVQNSGDSQHLLYKKIRGFSDGEAHFYSMQKDKLMLDNKYKFIYVDDGLLTGKRARTDLSRILSILPCHSCLYVFYLFAYSNGFNYTKKVIDDNGVEKDIRVKYYAKHILYNERNNKKDKIQFIWPHESIFGAKSNVFMYCQKIHNKIKVTGSAYYTFNRYKTECDLFQQKDSGHIVERAFSEKGVDLYNTFSETKYLPLGVSNNNDTLGFGAFIATDLNIPNNAPLVLWWGDIDSEDKWGWYPLFPRRGNKQLYEEIKTYNERYSLKNYLGNLKEILKIVRSLATEKEQEYLQEYKNKNGLQIGDMIDEIWSDIVKNRGRNLLENYLMKQDLDTIKVIETIMYIGRDYTPSEGNASFPVNDPNRLLKEWMRDLGEANGWNSQEVEVEQILSKLPAGRYLDRAFQILGIKE